MFGNPETTPGGKALKFYASVSIDVRCADALKDSDGIMGNKTKAKIVKNKLAPPFRTAEFDILYGEGISQEGCIIDLGTACNVIAKSGSWFAYEGEKVAQGREKMRDWLKSNPDKQAEIEQKIRAAYKPAKEEPAPGEEEEDEEPAE